MFPGVMPSGGSSLNKKERELLKLLKSLGEPDQQSLVAFAQFLSSRADAVSNTTEAVMKEDEIPTQPLIIPRPDEESVIKAIKRLTTTFPMVDKENILHPISDLMTSHMIQGKSAPAVIDELEKVFLKEYETQFIQQSDLTHNKKSEK